MGRDAFFCQGWQLPSRTFNVLGQDVFKSRAGHGYAAGVEEELKMLPLAAHCKPGAQCRRGFFPQRQQPLAPPLAIHMDNRLRKEFKVVEAQPYQLRYAKPGGEGQMQHGAVTDTGTMCEVGCIE